MLTDKDIKHMYGLLDGEMCDFDCGEVCSLKHRKRMPYCCENINAMPVLYREEYKYLRSQTKMWKKHNPREGEHLDELEFSIYAKCKGYDKCERRFRGIVCRNFPTYPYFNAGGKAIGLFFNRSLKGRCYLIDRPGVIRKEFIKANIEFWNFLLPKVPDEWDFYIKFAEQMERMVKRHGRRFIILKP
jgi:hypothetical protein